MHALPPHPPAIVQLYTGACLAPFGLWGHKRMSANFDKAFAMIVSAEGGYSNNPTDPGGETKFGISKRAYPNEDIANMTLARAKEIYGKDFWQAAHGDDLPWPLALFVFDAAVNQGLPAAVMLLQKSLGIAQDGSFGSRTQKAIASADGKELCSLFMADRALRYTGTRNFDTFGRGWLKRLFKTTMEAS